MNHQPDFELPADRARDMQLAKRLEWLTLAYMSSVILLMYLVMGSSEAMRTAWLEDLLSLVPPIGFLGAARVRYRPADWRYPCGYHRAINIAYFVSALALLAMGALLLINAVWKLLQAQHPTIGVMTVFGQPVWQGWLMLPVLVWATIPAFLLGRVKIGIAERLHDKPLYADAEMNKADWMTGAAAAAGVLGIGWGWWWADAVAAGLISVDILWDGVRNLRAVVGDLMDRSPMTVDHRSYLDLPHKIVARLQKLDGVQDAAVRLREYGHVLNGDLFVVLATDTVPPTKRRQIIQEIRLLDWRLHEITVQFVEPDELKSEKLHYRPGPNQSHNPPTQC